MWRCIPNVRVSCCRCVAVGTILILRDLSSKPSASTVSAFFVLVLCFLVGGSASLPSSGSRGGVGRAILAPPVGAGAEDVNDREKVFAEFLLGRKCRSSAQDQESPTGLLNQILDEVEGKTTESVSVGDHKLAYVARKAES